MASAVFGVRRVGMVPQLSQHAAPHVEMAQRDGVRYELGFAHRLLGEISLKTSPAQAAPHFEKSIAIFQEIKAKNELAMAYEGYGRLHKQQGRITEARKYLLKAVEIFERLASPIEPNKVREVLAELPEA